MALFYLLIIYIIYIKFLINKNEIDYMRENIFWSLYLLIYLFLVKFINLNLDLTKYINIFNNIRYYIYISKNNIFNIFMYKYINNMLQYKHIKLVINILFNQNIINSNIQSAENFKEFSETIRQSYLKLFIIIKNYVNNNYIFLYKYLNTIIYNKNYLSTNNIPVTTNLKNNINLDNDYLFWSRLAGIIDGNGNFKIIKIEGKNVLKYIEIKVNNKDIRILNYILNKLHMGKIYRYKNNINSKLIISINKDMEYIIIKLNGLIRLKVINFKNACNCLNIKYLESNYIINNFDPYFAGLIDTIGIINYNYITNNIECYIELKSNIYTSKLNLDNLIPNLKPLKKINKQKNNTFIIFKYPDIINQNINDISLIYDYFMKNRLYSDSKFFIITKILKFINIRDYKYYPYNSEEYLIYSEFIINLIKYKNPKWYKLTYINNLRMNR